MSRKMCLPKQMSMGNSLRQGKLLYILAYICSNLMTLTTDVSCNCKQSVINSIETSRQPQFLKCGLEH